MISIFRSIRFDSPHAWRWPKAVVSNPTHPFDRLTGGERAIPLDDVDLWPLDRDLRPDEAMTGAMELGANGYVVKPFTADKLKEVLDRVLA